MEGPAIVLVNSESPPKLHRFTCPHSLQDAVAPTWKSYRNETKARLCVEGALTWCGDCGKDINEVVYDVRPETQDLFAELVNECLGYWGDDIWTAVKHRIDRMEPDHDQFRFRRMLRILCREKRSLQNMLDMHE